MPDIDFDHCIIHINRVSLYTKDRGIFTSVPKTNKSRRTNKLPGYVFSVLHRLRTEQLEQRLSMGDQWVESGRVFIATNGPPILPSLPYQWLQRFCRDHDFPFYGIHTFRHLNASLLINEGIDVRTVSVPLGHAHLRPPLISTPKPLLQHRL